MQEINFFDYQFENNLNLIDINLNNNKDSKILLTNIKNIEDIKRILKYIKNGKLDVKSWDNIDELKNSFELLIEEHKDYMDHMKLHH